MYVYSFIGGNTKGSGSAAGEIFKVNNIQVTENLLGKYFEQWGNMLFSRFLRSTSEKMALFKVFKVTKSVFKVFKVQ